MKRRALVEIKIKNKQKKTTISQKNIVNLAKQVLKIKGVKRAELSILFVGKKRIRTLNGKFRNIDKPTDVLAFGMHEGKALRIHPEILGDVVICPEVARAFARHCKTSEKYEICLCLVHGILHLLGYRDSNRKMSSLMEKEQAKIFKRLFS